MSPSSVPDPTSRFVEYFGELGARWGLPVDACRVHAFLYVMDEPSAEKAIISAIDISRDALDQALAFLVDYELVNRVGTSQWRTSGDPWDMLINGLEQRRRRELPPALSLLRQCHQEAMAEGAPRRTVARQIGRMLVLAEDLAAIDAQVHRISPNLLRGLVSVSGRVARLANRTIGANKNDKRHDPKPSGD